MDKEAVEKLKKTRSAHRSLTTKLINKIENYLNETDFNINNAEALLEQICAKQNLLKEFDEKVCSVLDVNSIENDIIMSEEYVEKISVSKTKLQSKIRTCSQQPSLNASSIHDNRQSKTEGNSITNKNTETKLIKLPKLCVSKFNGNPSEFLEFWNQYDNSIHKNETLSDIDKFCYLKSLLTGVASDVIKGFMITPENYKEAIDLLNKTFGQKDVLINTHMTNLLNIPPLRNSKNLPGLRNLYYMCQTQIRSLNSLEIKSESYSNLLCPILLKLIPADLTLEFSKTQNDTLTYNLDDLMKFLHKELISRERANALNPENRELNNEIIRQNKFDRDSIKYKSQKPHRNFTPPSQLSSTSGFVMSAAKESPSESERNCLFCDSLSHYSEDCRSVKIDNKKEKLKREGRCFLCLKRKHRIFQCTVKNGCTNCGFRHNKTLCYKLENKMTRPNQTKVESTKNDEPINTVSNFVGNDKNGILLQTIKTKIIGDSKSETAFLLFDNGSERTFIRKDLSRKLKLRTVGQERLLIHSFQSKEAKRQICKRVLVTLRNIIDNKDIFIEALEIDEISDAELTLPNQKIKNEVLTKGITLTHSVKDISAKNKISILVGGDYYWQLVTGKIERLSSHLVAIDSVLGWSIQGRVNGYNKSVFVHFVVLNDDDVSNELKKFWEVESLGILQNNENAIDNEEQEILRDFNNSIQFVNNRYRVKLPWKEGMKDKLSNNERIASERFRKLRRNLENNQPLLMEYNKVLREYFDEGIIENAKFDNNLNSYYMPHRAVIREDKTTTKVRIVYDASSHAKEELSLNDCLHVGPNLNPNLFEILLKFRENRIAIIADIKQAFLQIELDESDRNFARFFWTNDSDNNKLDVLQFTRVLFGVRPSPFLLSATLKYHFEKYKDKFPNTYDVLKSSFYVDDLITGCEDTNKAFEFSVECMKILNDAGMLLRKFNSNSKDLIKLWEDAGIDVEKSPEIITMDTTSSKVLGVAWNAESDEFYFDVSQILYFLKNEVNTKRFILQVVGRIFDPLGFICPFIVRLKCLLQQIWCSGTNWDADLPDNLIRSWVCWKNEVADLSNLRISRHYLNSIKSEEIEKFEVHCFSDASKLAYGAILYLRMVLRNGDISVNFICAKSRVSPLKTLSLPRLELMSALLSARLFKQVAGCLKFDVNVFFWTDSTITFHWIRGNSEIYKPFVKNRIKDIQDLSDPSRWFHCPGKDNPADILSRGMSASELCSSSLWWHGPTWLGQQPECWPVYNGISPTSNDDLELRKQFKKIHQNYCLSTKLEELLDLKKFSNFLRLIRITAWIIRFVARIKKTTDNVGPLTAHELKEAEEIWIRTVQVDHFKDEIQTLDKKQELSKDSPLYSFAPILDQNILKIGGRLEKSEFTISEKHPVILPRNSVFTALIVKHEHNKIFHGGIAATLTSIRTKYWIPKARQLVKKIIRNCLICKRYTAQPAKQITAQLPKDRISETPPFSVCGIDFAGPIFVKTSDGPEKAYIALFTCAVTRALHLELVSNLSTEKFLLAMRRFLSRRGNCLTIYSDNAKTFKCASKEFKHFAALLKHQDVQNFISNKGITWKNIIERAAWWGGFYERLVKSVKECLRKILGKALLSFEELLTLLTEVEFVLNSRPLTYVYAESTEPEPLTPAHFLNFGKKNFDFPLNFIELFQENSTRSSLVKRKALQLKLLKQIWLKWKNQYLLDLRSAHRLTIPNDQKELKVGDVVLLEGTAKSKLLWELGVIEELYIGRDQRVRSCLIRTAKGQLKRPVQLLYPLELSNEH